VVLAHPDPESFNHAIARTAVESLRSRGHEVRFHDLYREDFDPVLPRGELPESAPLPPLVALHCREIAAADGIVIVHPNWWGQPPALLKGWVDRVIRPGVAYRFLEGDDGEGVPLGLLRARAAAVFNTANTPPAREAAFFGDPLEAIWKRCVFGLCGVGRVHRETFAVVVTSTPATRRRWLARVERVLGRLFPGADASPSRKTGGGN
jgi:putative NADPH-quinone reductase